MHITSRVDSLYTLRDALRELTTELTTIDRTQYLGMLDQTILLQEVVQHWYNFLLIVRYLAVNPYLVACADLELDHFLHLSQRIEFITRDKTQ